MAGSMRRRFRTFPAWQHVASQTEAPSCCSEVCSKLQAVEEQLAQTQLQLQQALRSRPALSSAATQTDSTSQQLVPATAEEGLAPPVEFPGATLKSKDVDINPLELAIYHTPQAPKACSVPYTGQPETAPVPRDDQLLDCDQEEVEGEGQKPLPAALGEVEVKVELDLGEWEVSGLWPAAGSPSLPAWLRLAESELTASNDGEDSDELIDICGDDSRDEVDPSLLMPRNEELACDSDSDSDMDVASELAASDTGRKQYQVISGGAVETGDWKNPSEFFNGGGNVSPAASRASEDYQLEVSCRQGSVLLRPNSCLRKPRGRLHHCAQCPRTYATAASVQRHVRIAHLQERPFACRACGRRFAESRDHLVHERKTCGLLSLDHLQLPQPNPQQGSSVPHICHLCGKVYPNFGSVNRHFYEVHVKDMPAWCRVCEKEFTEECKLSNHTQMLGQRQRQRQQREEQLQDATVNQPESVPSKCALCSDVFASPSKARSHMCNVLQAWPFWCGVCGKACLEKTHLWSHMQVHRHKGEFPCIICRNTYSKIGFLQRHIVLVHKQGKSCGLHRYTSHNREGGGTQPHTYETREDQAQPCSDGLGLEVQPSATHSPGCSLAL